MTPEQVRELPCDQWLKVEMTPLVLAELMECAIVRRDGVVVRITDALVAGGHAMLSFTMTDDHAVITNGGAVR